MTIGPATCARRQRSLQPTASSPPAESRAAAYFVPDFSTAACAETRGESRIDPAQMDQRIGGVDRLLVLLIDTALPHHATEADLCVLAGTAEPVIEVEVAERGVEIVAPHQADRAFAEPDAFSTCGDGDWFDGSPPVGQG